MADNSTAAWSPNTLSETNYNYDTPIREYDPMRRIVDDNNNTVTRVRRSVMDATVRVLRAAGHRVHGTGM